MKKPISYFLGEGLLIVFSILLALGVNEWRVRAGEAAEERKAMADIRAELIENRDLLEDIPAYHRDLSEALSEEIDSLGPDDPRTPMEIFTGLDVLRSTIIIERLPQSVTWQVSKDRGVVGRFDYETAKALSRTYDHQQAGVMVIYETVAEMLIQPEMYIPENQGPTLRPLAAAFGELASREQLLVKMQKDNIEALGGEAR
ncbi:hypothetical protein [Hyphococcus sp.]|jgi:hypothetical protein|uniref:hypothetical protein n=1 Tax=Hyphococcus sp. TaxID=2038636 RepID=UPI003D0D2B6D